MSKVVSSVNDKIQHSVATVSRATALIGFKDTTVPVNIGKGVFEEYNFFVDRYNDDCNRVDNKFLKKVNTSISVHECSDVFVYCCSCAGVVPFFSIPFLIFAVYRFIMLIRIIIVVHQNRNYVKNPFMRMIYGQPAEGYQNSFLEITARIDYQQFSLMGISSDEFQLFSARIDQQVAEGKPFKVMIYNAYFSANESDVLKHMCLKIYFTFFSY